MEAVVNVIQQLWLDVQQGTLPDLGGWNYMLMAMLIMVQGRASALLGGIAAASGHLNLGLIILVALMARLAVDLFWYRVGSSRYVDRIGQRVGTYDRVAGQLQERLQDGPIRLVLLAKLSSGLSLPVIIAAGSARLPFRSWLPASFAAEFLWTLPLLLLGFFAADAVAGVKGGLTYMTMGLTPAILLVFILQAIRSRKVGAGPTG